MINIKTTNITIQKLPGYLVLLSIGMMLLSCGKTTIEIDQGTYEPKIVIHGYIYPERPVTGIEIKRNFPVGEVIDKDQMHLSSADVKITDLESNTVYQLRFNSDSLYFEYPQDDLKIEYGGKYRLTVNAEIDGQELTASAETEVPGEGLEIIPDYSIYGSFQYRQTDGDGNLVVPLVVYSQSPNSAFYLLSISSLEADVESFIYENPFEFDINDALEEDANIEDFQYSFRWSRPMRENSGYGAMPVEWFQLWFYGRYRLILYAGDLNFFHFNRTHQNVQGPDGNLHEPVFDIEGDGIGVFASAVTDTVFLEVLKNGEQQGN